MRNYKFMIVTATIMISVLSVVACGSSEDDVAIQDNQTSATNEAVSEPSKTESPKQDSNNKTYTSVPVMSIDKSKNYNAIIEMEKGGEIVIQLFANEAPITVNNFVSLARDGYYDGVTFHRVIEGFMAQGGDPTGTGTGGPGYEFDNELTPKRRHDGPGVLSMANAGIQNGKGTNGSQFFITFTETHFLDGYNLDDTAKDCSQAGVSCHTVFGNVIKGMDVVNSITVRDPNTSIKADVMKTIRITEN